MSEVKRFDCTSGSARFCNGCYTMTECIYGDYVLHDDYAALEAHNDQLAADNQRLREALETAKYRIEQGRVWNGMGWTLNAIDAALSTTANGEQLASASEGE